MSIEILLSIVAGVACVAVPWTVARWALRGADLSSFDRPTGERFSGGDAPSAELKAVIASLGGLRSLLQGVPFRQRNAVLRKYMDEIFADRELNVRTTPVDCGGVPGEWVLAPGADPSRHRPGAAVVPGLLALALVLVAEVHARRTVAGDEAHRADEPVAVAQRVAAPVRRDGFQLRHGPLSAAARLGVARAIGRDLCSPLLAANG
jgi:hypothetical protein